MSGWWFPPAGSQRHLRSPPAPAPGWGGCLMSNFVLEIYISSTVSVKSTWRPTGCRNLNCRLTTNFRGQHDYKSDFLRISTWGAHTQAGRGVGMKILKSQLATKFSRSNECKADFWEFLPEACTRRRGVVWGAAVSRAPVAHDTSRWNEGRQTWSRHMCMCDVLT